MSNDISAIAAKRIYRRYYRCNKRIQFLESCRKQGIIPISMRLDPNKHKHLNKKKLSNQKFQRLEHVIDSETKLLESFPR